MASAFKLESIDIITNDSSTQAWGSSVSGLGYTFHNRLVYRTDSVSGGSNKVHTYTKDTGVTAIMVTVTGGGGGGGAGTSAYIDGGGGNAGGSAIRWITATDNDSTPTSFLNTTSVSVTVGEGGAGSSSGNGSTGGTTSFGSFCSATGGGGGRHGTNQSVQYSVEWEADIMQMKQPMTEDQALEVHPIGEEVVVVLIIIIVLMQLLVLFQVQAEAVEHIPTIMVWLVPQALL